MSAVVLTVCQKFNVVHHITWVRSNKEVWTTWKRNQLSRSLCCVLICKLIYLATSTKLLKINTSDIPDVHSKWAMCVVPFSESNLGIHLFELHQMVHGSRVPLTPSNDHCFIEKKKIWSESSNSLKREYQRLIVNVKCAYLLNVILNLYTVVHMYHFALFWSVSSKVIGVIFPIGR